MKSWKLQKFFGDLVYDLRNRGLLPVVVLLLVALVAIPVVITRGGSSSAPIADTAALQEAVASAPEAQSAVVAYEPGLRKYQDRLDKLSPKDPFEQQFSAAVQAATELSGTVSGETAPGETPSGGESTGTVEPTSGSDPSTKKKKKKKKKKSTTKYYSYQTDVMVGEAGASLQPLTNVAPLTPLPSETAPVLIYLGTNTSGQFALFLVSNEVSQASGPGVCIPKPEDCALIALSQGQTEDLAYVDGKTYRIQVTRLEQVVTSTPPG
jgi:hypothetical protein